MGWRQYLIAFLMLVIAPGAFAAQVTVTVDWPAWSGDNSVQIYDAGNTTAITAVFNNGVGNQNENTPFQGSQTYTLAHNASFTLRMTDSFGDAWNGNGTVTVAVDGVTVLTSTGPPDTWVAPTTVTETFNTPPRLAVFSAGCVAVSVPNGGFEDPGVTPNTYSTLPETDVPGWSTDASDGQIELWGTIYEGVPSIEGGVFAEVSANEVAALTQEFSGSLAGDRIEWSYWHRGRQGPDTLSFGFGVEGGSPIVLQTATTSNSDWVNYTGSADVPAGDLRFEFRSVSSAGSLPSIGNFLDDFQFAVCAAPRDYSDAPITGTNYGGANHAIVSGFQLGASVTNDTADFNDSAAAADAGDDGATIPALTRGRSATISVDVGQVNAGDGYLQAWIDWNGDGDFADLGEQVATNMQSPSVGTSTISLPVNVPSDATLNPTFARFRWSTAAGLDSISTAPDGEVEDYQVTIAAFVPLQVGGMCLGEPLRFVPLVDENPAAGSLGWANGQTSRTYTNVKGLGVDLLVEAVLDTDGVTPASNIVFVESVNAVQREGGSWQLKITAFETGTTTPAELTDFTITLEDFETGENLNEVLATPAFGTSLPICSPSATVRQIGQIA